MISALPVSGAWVPKTVEAHGDPPRISLSSASLSWPKPWPPSSGPAAAGWHRRRRLTCGLLEVDTGAEGRVGAGEDHGVDARVVPGGDDRVPQRIGDGPAERVARFRPVERHRRDAVLDVNEDDGLREVQLAPPVMERGSQRGAAQPEATSLGS